MCDAFARCFPASGGGRQIPRRSVAWVNASGMQAQRKFVHGLRKATAEVLHSCMHRITTGRWNLQPPSAALSTVPTESETLTTHSSNSDMNPLNCTCKSEENAFIHRGHTWNRQMSRRHIVSRDAEPSEVKKGLVVLGLLLAILAPCFSLGCKGKPPGQTAANSKGSGVTASGDSEDELAGRDLHPQTGDEVLDALFRTIAISRRYTVSQIETAAGGQQLDLCFEPDGAGRMISIPMDEDESIAHSTTLFSFTWQLVWDRGELYHSPLDSLRLRLTRDLQFKQRDGSAILATVSAEYAFRMRVHGLETTHTDADDFVNVTWEAVSVRAPEKPTFFDSPSPPLTSRHPIRRDFPESLGALVAKKHKAFIAQYGGGVMSATWTEPRTARAQYDGLGFRTYAGSGEGSRYERLSLQTREDDITARFYASEWTGGFAGGGPTFGVLDSARIADGQLILLFKELQGNSIIMRLETIPDWREKESVPLSFACDNTHLTYTWSHKVAPTTAVAAENERKRTEIIERFIKDPIDKAMLDDLAKLSEEDKTRVREGITAKAGESPIRYLIGKNTVDGSCQIAKDLALGGGGDQAILYRALCALYSDETAAQIVRMSQSALPLGQADFDVLWDMIVTMDPGAKWFKRNQARHIEGGDGRASLIAYLFTLHHQKKQVGK